MYTYTYISLSLYIYIYTYIHTHTSSYSSGLRGAGRPQAFRPTAAAVEELMMTNSADSASIVIVHNVISIGTGVDSITNIISIITIITTLTTITTIATITIITAITPPPGAGRTIIIDSNN